MIGETIGNFQIVSQLGSGGMGDVFLAEQMEIHTKVAIKLLHANISTDQTQIKRFFGEAVAVSGIKHAGIVRIFDVGFTPTGRAYLVMEYLEGETLASRIEKAGRMSLADVADVGRQTAGVLAATHAEGVVHRDLKPDNIYLVRDAEMARGERVKILDFGIAKLANTKLTGSANSMGTPTYMAPEQWNHSGGVDWRADMYSLGCLAFEMVCGRPPFVAASIGEACAMHLSEPAPSARAFVPECPPALDALLSRMLAKSPNDRPASMAEVAAGFSAHADSPTGPMYAVGAPTGNLGAAMGATLPTSSGAPAAGFPVASTGMAPPHQPTEVVPRKKSRAVLFGALALVLAGGVAGAVVVATRGGEAKKDGKHGMVARDAGIVVDGSAIVAAPSDGGAVKPSTAIANNWIEIPLPAKPIVLGLDSESAPDSEHGFRPSRKIISPTAPYKIQAHEVTWSELEPYLAANDLPAFEVPEFPAWAKDPAKRARLPATNVSWQLAHDYCVSIKGELPSEEEWELAARGGERRPNSWGANKLDRMLTHTLVGPAGAPNEVMKSDQDKTPGDVRVFDLIGNVQEWTEGLWREDKAGSDEAWVEDGDTTFRALRGLPLHGAATTKVQTEAAAYREVACATGDCKGRFPPPLDAVGFRCVQNEKTINKPPIVAVAPTKAKVDAGVAPVDAGAMSSIPPDASVPKRTPPLIKELPEKPPPSEVKAAFDGLRQKVRDCAARNPRARGSHRVTLRIAADGHVSSSVQTPNPGVRACIEEAADALTFSKSRDGTSVSTTFDLSPLDRE